MDEQALKRFLDEALEPIIERLDDPKTGLKRTNEKIDALWDQVEKVTIGMEDIKETLDSHTTQLRKKSHNSGRLFKYWTELLTIDDTNSIMRLT